MTIGSRYLLDRMKRPYRMRHHYFRIDKNDSSNCSDGESSVCSDYRLSYGSLQHVDLVDQNIVQNETALPTIDFGVESV
jgi:hypothetical protein